MTTVEAPKIAAPETVKAATPPPAAAAEPAKASPAPVTEVAKAPAKPAAPVKATDLVGLGDDAPEGSEVPSLGEEVAEPEAAKPEAAEAEKPADGDAPIEYDFGEAPEGHTYRAPVLDAAKTWFSKHKIAGTDAKEFIDSMLPVLQADAVEQEKQYHEAKSAEFRAEFVARHGAKAKDVIRHATTFFKTAPESVQNMFRGTALAWHPDFLDWMAAHGGQSHNDRPVKGTGAPSIRPMTPEQVIEAEYQKDETTATAKRGQ
jgi:hypothetical protein